MSTTFAPSFGQVLQHFAARGELFRRGHAVLVRADAYDGQRFAARRNRLGDERQRGGLRRRGCGELWLEGERGAGGDASLQNVAP